jgi:hypothetical protein
MNVFIHGIIEVGFLLSLARRQDQDYEQIENETENRKNRLKININHIF